MVAILLFLFCLGGFGYGCLEILWRGYTHWSMFLAGGICLILIYRVNLLFGNAPFLLRCLIGALAITTVELAIGLMVNIGLGLQVWDYSKKPLNFLGQICLSYSVLWFLLCVPLTCFCRWLSHFRL